MAMPQETASLFVPQALVDTPYDGDRFLQQLTTALATMRFHPYARQQITRTFVSLCQVLSTCAGQTLQERWQTFERQIWPVWLADQDRPAGKWWTGAVRIAVTARLVRPGWDLLCTSNTATWMKHLSERDPLTHQADLLKKSFASLSWARPEMRAAALNAGLRLLLAHGYDTLQQITEQDLLDIPSAAELGSDTLDAALCALLIFPRTPKRAGSRHGRKRRLSTQEMVAVSPIPACFRQVTALYLDTYAARISPVYETLRHKTYSLAHFWSFITATYPEVHTWLNTYIDTVAQFG